MTPDLKGHNALQIYNGLDCCITFEIDQKLEELMKPENELVYAFERGMQAPALDMMLRGVLIDEYERQVGIKKMKAEMAHVEVIWHQYCEEAFGRRVNIRSNPQLQVLFYEWMKLPVQFKRRKDGTKSPSVDRGSLEKLYLYLYARPFIECIWAYSDSKKRLNVLETEVDADGRMRTSYNVAGTETGRWSSSSNSTGGGTNLQNITAELRRMFIADFGWKMCGIDLEQAESRVCGLLIGWLFNDWAYLNACEVGDLHTFVCQMVWPELPWTDDPKQNKEIAEQQFYRHFTYRDMGKRGGHASNYMVTPWTMSQHLKIKQAICELFQQKYYGAFPFQRWHRWVSEQLTTKGYLDSPLGDRRHFFGRTHDDTTLRAAIAHVPQGVVGRLLNVALWRVWHFYRQQVQLLLQVHDAIYFQYPDDGIEDEIVPRILKLVEVPLTLGGRTMVIPGEAKVGWNWANEEDKRIPNWVNPNGLRKWKSGKPDPRRRLIGLDRPIS